MNRYGPWIGLKISNNANSFRKILSGKCILQFKCIVFFAYANIFFDVIFINAFSFAEIQEQFFNFIFYPVKVVPDMIYQ